MLTTQTANVHIRWMTRAELPYVLDIERRSFPAHAWGEEAFLSELRKRTVIGMAAVREERVLGYVIYELHGDRMDVLNFAVHPFYRGQGVGSQMIGKLKAKLHSHRRGAIRLDAREQSLPFQKFLRHHEFRAVRVVRRHFDDTGEDAFRFEFRDEGEAQ